MENRLFKFYEDLEGNNDGWRPAFGNMSLQGGGWTVAHLCLEQRKDSNSGSFADELEALGRMWWLRLDSGFERTMATDPQRHAMSVSELLGESVFEALMGLAYTPNLRFAMLGTQIAPTLDESCEDVLAGALEYFAGRMRTQLVMLSSQHPDWKVISGQNLQAIGNVLRRGYVDAQMLYPDNEAAAYRLFGAISTLVNTLDDAERAEPGDMLHVQFDPATFHVEAKRTNICEPA
jgi:hypothetical protein